MTSKTGLERLAVLETEVKQVRADVAEVRLHQSQNHQELSQKIDKLLKHVDGKFTNHEVRIRSMEETVEPITAFRKKLWGVVVVAALTIATASVILLEIKRS